MPHHASLPSSNAAFHAPLDRRARHRHRGPRGGAGVCVCVAVVPRKIRAGSLLRHRLDAVVLCKVVAGFVRAQRRWNRGGELLAVRKFRLPAQRAVSRPGQRAHPFRRRARTGADRRPAAIRRAFSGRHFSRRSGALARAAGGGADGDVGGSRRGARGLHDHPAGAGGHDEFILRPARASAREASRRRAGRRVRADVVRGNFARSRPGRDARRMRGRLVLRTTGRFRKSLVFPAIPF